jgi:hypothetical protein
VSAKAQASQIDQIKKATTQSTLKNKSKTRQGMLPPLMPCSNARARILIRKGRAKVYRLFPFTIQLIGRASGDMQALENPTSRLEYQRGMLFGAELWEYLLEKWGRTCLLRCGKPALEAEHIVHKRKLIAHL